MIRKYVGAAALLVTLACSSDPDVVVMVVKGGTEAAATVGAAGGELQLASGAGVQIPRGALSEDVEIEVVERRATDFAAIEEAADLEKPLVLRPHGTSFDQDVTLRLPLERATSLDRREFGDLEKDIRVVKLDDEEDEDWRDVRKSDFEIIDDDDGRRVEVRTRGFSVYMVGYAAASDDQPVDASVTFEASAGENGRGDAAVPSTDGNGGTGMVRDASAMVRDASKDTSLVGGCFEQDSLTEPNDVKPPGTDSNGLDCVNFTMSQLDGTLTDATDVDYLHVAQLPYQCSSFVVNTAGLDSAMTACIVDVFGNVSLTCPGGTTTDGEGGCCMAAQESVTFVVPSPPTQNPGAMYWIRVSAPDGGVSCTDYSVTVEPEAG